MAESAGRERTVQLAANLWRFWNVRGYLSEWREWLALALEARSGEDPAQRGEFDTAGALRVDGPRRQLWMASLPYILFSGRSALHPLWLFPRLSRRL
ncbi:MAG: hypothetical protein ACRDHY_06275 [Anaerolineales bacterium]